LSAIFVRTCEKNEKSWKSLLTLLGTRPKYASPTTAATLLATKKFASEFREKLDQIQESRVSDTLQARSQKQQGHDTASAMSVL
jgi:hypothetical protein